MFQFTLDFIINKIISPFSKMIAFARRNIAITFLIGVLGIVSAKGASGQAFFALSQTFINPIPKEFDLFGGAIALSSNLILISAPNNDTGAIDSGAAYLFDATTGRKLQTFSNPTPSNDDNFGWSVALSETRALISTGSDNTNAANSGAAYLFDTTTGNLLQTFLNPTPAENDRFGSPVVLLANKALISAPLDDIKAQDSGAVYLFDISTSKLLQTFLNPSPEAGDAFGASTALFGNFALISAPSDNTSAKDSGAAYLFDITTGKLLYTFLNPTPALGDRFGSSISLSGNFALIGTWRDDTSAENSGAAYLFDTSTGKLLQIFLNPTPEASDQFGFSVALSENLAFIGARTDNIGALDSGAAYLFNITTGNLLQTFPNPNPGLGDFFGRSVVLSNNYALISADYDNAGARKSGAVYLFTASK
ncbi:MAG: hypothetical protein HC908_12485 [Calothrix sp. SM1_7_51]|nr:hypothetical protein [Calothrix sp. SM1_7_51]